MGLGKDNCKTRRETFEFGDFVRLILDFRVSYGIEAMAGDEDGDGEMRIEVKINVITMTLYERHGVCPTTCSDSA